MAGLACQPFMYSGVPEWPGWLGVFALGALSSGVPTTSSPGGRRVSAVEATLIPSFEPLLNPLWVFLGQGERPGAYAIVGGLVVLLAVTVQGCWPPAAAEAASPPRDFGVTLPATCAGGMTMFGGFGDARLWACAWPVPSAD